MRLQHVATFGLGLAAACAGPPAEPFADDESLVTETTRFVFHSNLWVNLNHHLYMLGTGDGRQPVDPAHLALVDALPDAEREIWDRAVAYYAAHHAADHIRTDDSLFTFKRWVLDVPELLFHESSHGVMGGWSPVGQAIDSVAAALGREHRGQLWHALLFYFSGRAVQDELAALGREHTLYMVDRDVFSEVHPLLFEHVEPYVVGDLSLEEALEGVFAGMERR